MISEPPLPKLTPPHIFDNLAETNIPNRIVLTAEQGKLVMSLDGIQTVHLDLSIRENRVRLQANLWHKVMVLTNDMDAVHRLLCAHRIHVPYPQYLDVRIVAEMLNVAMATRICPHKTIPDFAAGLLPFLRGRNKASEYRRQIQMKIVAIEMELSGIPCDWTLIKRYSSGKDKDLLTSLERGYSRGRVHTKFSLCEKSWRLKCEDVAVLSIPKSQIRMALRSRGKIQVFADFNAYHVRLVAEASACHVLAKLLEKDIDLHQYTFDHIKHQSLYFVPLEKGREIGKRLLHATINGGGEPAFRKAFAKVGIDIPHILDLKKIRADIFGLFPGIAAVQRGVMKSGVVSTIMGRKIVVGEGTLGEKVAAFLQGTEADLMAEMAWAVRTSCQDIPGFTLNLCWYDAIYAECSPGHEEELAERLCRAMEDLLADLGLQTPFKAKVVISESWATQDGKTFDREEYQLQRLKEQLADAKAGSYLSIGGGPQVKALSVRNQDLITQIADAEFPFYADQLNKVDHRSADFGNGATAC